MKGISLGSIGIITSMTAIPALLLLITPNESKAGFFSNCYEVDRPIGASFSTKYMVCDDLGDRVMVQCNSLGSNCIKVCSVDGYGSRRCGF